ncbi:alpha-glucan family phosphorylase [Bacillota bacterium LX-D]|nr:alpha-glucan family phosphorylase [Bacillota bacterium LX-D]
MMSSEKLPQVAYFCMEYGLDKELPIYAGGLGILAGDYLKSAKDLDYPVVGIGILWKQDYTTQLIGEDGRPYDQYPTYDYSFVKDTGKTITVRVRGEEVTCKIKVVDQYENAPLYLLDTNFPGSPHGWMTCRLYGGGAQDRIANEIILGIGGVRALRALGISPAVYHFNEGHAVFAGLELIREKMKLGMDFEKAWQEIRKQIVFTTHTPVEAGNEMHDHGLLQHMEAYNGLNYEQMNRLGGNPFNMTVAALRLSSQSNAVSKIHAHTAQEMWKNIEDKAPIVAITNAVHAKTWQNPEIKAAYDAGNGLWDVHKKAKEKLIQYIQDKNQETLKADALIIGFARRAAAYKRSELIFRDFEKIKPLLNEGKIQLVFSGKAHPNDQHGKDIIARIVNMDKTFGNSVVFLENYDMDIAKILVQGCDVWLNNPKRPLEASGTSGMKAALNGVLNISVVDGWVAEGVKHKESGWLLDYVCQREECWKQDEFDAQALYYVLQNEVLPTYYNDQSRWEKMMKASIEMAESYFTAERMVKEYYEKMYMQAAQAKQPAWMLGNEFYKHETQNQLNP